jgi:hypothetical protein
MEHLEGGRDGIMEKISGKSGEERVGNFIATSKKCNFLRGFFSFHSICLRNICTIGS